jgi:hypothetical protein
LEAIAAVHRLIAARLERHLGNAAALAARGLVHFTALTAAAAHTGSAACIAHLLARLTAIGTTVRFVLETFAGVELLLAGRERELASTVHAVQHFINVHLNETPCYVVFWA